MFRLPAFMWRRALVLVGTAGSGPPRGGSAPSSPPLPTPPSSQPSLCGRRAANSLSAGIISPAARASGAAPQPTPHHLQTCLFVRRRAARPGRALFAQVPSSSVSHLPNRYALNVRLTEVPAPLKSRVPRPPGLDDARAARNAKWANFGRAVVELGPRPRPGTAADNRGSINGMDLGQTLERSWFRIFDPALPETWPAHPECARAGLTPGAGLYLECHLPQMAGASTERRSHSARCAAPAPPAPSATAAALPRPRGESNQAAAPRATGGGPRRRRPDGPTPAATPARRPSAAWAAAAWSGPSAAAARGPRGIVGLLGVSGRREAARRRRVSLIFRRV
jgi:hypothetical protein